MRNILLVLHVYFTVICLCSGLNNTTYIIGVAKEFISIANVTYNSTPGVNVQIKEIVRPGMFDARSFDHDYSLFQSYNFNAVINKFDHFLGILSNFASIPYYVLENTDGNILGPTMFAMDREEMDTTKITLAIINQKNITSISVIKDTDLLSDILHIDLTVTAMKIAEISFADSLDVLRQKVEPVIQKDTPSHAYVIITKTNNDSYIHNILNVAMHMGAVRKGDTWILNSLHVNFSVLSSYRKTNANIYTYRLKLPEITELSWLHNPYDFDAIDSVQHFIVSVKDNATDAVRKVQRGFLPSGYTGPVRFDNNRNRIDIDYDIYRLGTTMSPSTEYMLKVGNWKSGVFYMHEGKSNLTESVVRVAIFAEKPYVMNTTDGYEGFSVDFMRALQNQLNFKVEWVVLEHTIVGVKDENNSWSALMELFQNNSVDMVAAPIDKSLYNEDFLQFSDTADESAIALLVVTPEPKLSYFWILRPFTYNVWIAVILSVLLLSLVFWATDTISHYQHSPKEKHTEDNKEDLKEVFTFGYCLLIVFSSIVMAKPKTKPKHFSARVFAIILWFASLMLMATYASNMVPFLINPLPPLPFSDLHTLLINNDSFRWFFQESSSSYQLLVSQNHSLVTTAKEQWPIHLTVQTTEEVNQSLFEKRKYVFIGDALSIEYLFSSSCNMRKFGDLEYNIEMAFPVRKNWLHQKQMLQLINKVIALGNINKMIKAWFTTGLCIGDPTEGVNPERLTLKTIAGLYVLLGSIILLAFLSMLMEYIIKKVKVYRQRKIAGPFKFGKTYDAYVTQTTPDGVFAKINKRPNEYFMHASTLHSHPLKIETPEELGMTAKTRLQVTYFGKDPVTREKRFAIADESAA